MTLTRQQFLRGALGAGALATAGPGLAAETDFPQRPLKLVVPFAAGGATDTAARIDQAGRLIALRPRASAMLQRAADSGDPPTATPCSWRPTAR